MDARIDWSYEISQLERIVDENKQGYQQYMRKAADDMAAAEQCRQRVKRTKKIIKALRKLVNRG